MRTMNVIFNVLFLLGILFMAVDLTILVYKKCYESKTIKILRRDNAKLMEVK